MLIVLSPGTGDYYSSGNDLKNSMNDAGEIQDAAMSAKRLR